MSEQERNVPVAWSRRFRGGRPDQPILSRQQIIQTARRLLDEEGLEGLSMRRLGARLESGATSVYWYVANKDELLDLALDGVLAEVPIPEPTGDWRSDLSALVEGLRGIMSAHPWTLQLLHHRQPRGPHAFRFAEAQLTLLRAAGFAGDELDGAFHMIIDYLRGAMNNSVYRRVRQRTDSTTGAEMASAYPALAGQREHALRHDRASLVRRRFEFGLGVLLDGLAARLAKVTSA